MKRRFIMAAAVTGMLLCMAGAYGDGVLGDITIPRENGAAGEDFMPRAVFPHWIHRSEFKCYVCHDDIFQMQAGADHINMDEVQSGRFCGVCHNGKTAFAIGFNTCERCHYSANNSP